MKNYYLGLDIGTESIGWAATDSDYKLQKCCGKSLWGIRLFESGKTAQERRNFRAGRRRQDRRVERIKLLQELFSEEISKIDFSFYKRLKESKYYPEDKHDRYSLFSDNLFTDKEYHQKYPTIYHLRKELIENSDKKDIRLIYLAIHHIIKHRGHFLFEGRKIDVVPSFETVFEELIEYMREEYDDIQFEKASSDDVEEILKSKEYSITDKKRLLGKALNADTKSEKSIADLLAGGTVKLDDLFKDINTEDNEIKKIKFSDEKYDEQIDDLSNILQENMYLIEKSKLLYDWSVLAGILKGNKYLSHSKVETYEKHKRDLKTLKKVIKKYYSEEIYKMIFSDPKEKNNYCSYIGMCKKGGKKVAVEKKCSQEDFCKFLGKIINKKDITDTDYQYVQKEIDKKSLMPKQVAKENSVIPYQVHKNELRKILENASKHYNFLNSMDSDGYSAKDKIEKLLTFRIPYYVGPLNNYHKDRGGNSWIVKKIDEKIYPWNFEKVVNIEASAEGFITRMTNKCTYLIGEDVLPKESLLYSKYMVLNELNNLKINGEPISVEIKKQIFNDLFIKFKRVSSKKLKSYLMAEGITEKSDIIGGVDGDFKASMKSYIDFKKILGDNFNEEMIENIIKWIVLFGDEEKILKSRIKKKYSEKLSDNQIKLISKLKYAGWGRLSEKFLTEIYHVDRQTGECKSLITELYETNNNLMKLLSNKYGFKDAVIEYNSEISDITDYKNISYDSVVKNLALSPAVKRSVWQTLQIVREIRKVMKGDPQKVFVEVAREEGEKKRTQSRKNKLVELYKNCKEDEKELFNALDKQPEDRLRSDRLYLYFTQRGKCMYSGDRIDINDLYKNNIYDIDHIYPQSKVKDDSIENRVLVRRDINEKKSDVYPLPTNIRCKKNMDLWKDLYDKGLIGKTKYQRLIRSARFTNDELADFIARQLVEMRQSSKAIAEILGRIFPKTDIVYAKAGNVSDFRNKFDLLKSRDVNDFHHAKDAYLNIVVGNVYHTKFTSNPLNFIKKQEKYSYNMNRIFDFNVSRNGITAWETTNNESIRTVKSIINKNNILFTRYSSEEKGGFFDQMLMKKGKGQFPIKETDSRLSNIEKYGGYNKISGAYFALVEHNHKGKKVRSIEFVPIYLAKKIENDKNQLIKYFKEQLNNPKILIDKIKINTLFEIDGFMMHVVARTGRRLIFRAAHQLCIGYENEKYVKKITKYVERDKGRSDELKITEHDEISAEKNIELYNLFLNKLNNTVYKIRLSAQAKTLGEKRDKFIELPVEKQSKLLYEILHMFQCNRVLSDLSIVGGSKNAGTILISNDIGKFKKVKIIHQSPTGIFSNEIDLLKL